MSTLPDARAETEASLRAIGAAPDDALDIGEAALRLASLDRPRVPLDRYRAHLAELGREVGLAVRGEDVAAGVAALNDVILGNYGYQGDRLTYDDLQNANLMRVIDRRKGLPVALGILYMHAARAQGWPTVGLNFPSHFLLRLERHGERAILDPFNEGRVHGATELRDLLKAMQGQDAELGPEHYQPVTDRTILLRLQNNIKLRLVQRDETAKAAKVVETMLLFAPDATALWREAGLLNAHVGNLQAAIAALHEYVGRETAERPRHEAAILLQRLRSRLN